jgi:hypothetical protein
MRHVLITDRRRSAMRDRVVFEGTVVVDRRTETFQATYRQGMLTLNTGGCDIRVPVELGSGSVCSWPEVKDPIQQAMDGHFNSSAYAEIRAV